MTTDYELDYDVDAPPDTSVPFWKPSEHSGELAIIEVSHIAQQQKFRSTDMADHVYATVYILSGPNAGNKYRMESPHVKIVSQLKSKCGKRVVGRIQKESTDANAAWIVDTKNVTEDDRRTAEQFVKGETVEPKAPPF